MVNAFKRVLIGFFCMLLVISSLAVFGSAAEETELITDFNSLMTAVQNASDGDTLLVGDIDFSPLSPDVPNSMMYITVEKSLTVKGGKTEGASIFLNGGFVLSGGKSASKKISVRFENIVFDGKADYDTLTEKDYEHPWSEAEQAYTYNASIKAQQALSFMGNVNADFTECVFRNYMHEYGPVIDIRYADYTGNEYINLPDYSGCSLNVNFDRCRIEKNSALYDGGAIYIEANKNVVLNANKCIFLNNRSANGSYGRGGGAIYAEGATLAFTDCTFEKNTANHVFADTVIPEYDTHRGGALLLQDAKLTMINSVLLENRASMGGAVSFTNSGADIDGCRFIKNRAQAEALNPNGTVGPWSNMSQGGALYIEGNSNDTVSLINSEIKNNSAANAYGGIYGYYVPFEDPSLPTYNIQMVLCTYEENRDDVEYDYSTVGDLSWLSHPGDMFTNPHLTMFGCFIADETFEKDFPRCDAPSEKNGYNYLSATANGEMRNFVIPSEEAERIIGNRYGDRLSDFHVGSNYTELLYREEEESNFSTAETDPLSTETASSTVESDSSVIETDSAHINIIPNDENEPSVPTAWYILGAVLVLLTGCCMILILYLHKRKREITEVASTVNTTEKKTVVMTRYDDSEIDRFISLVPAVASLTARELEVLREILRGKKQGEVAYYLGIEVTTVKDFYKKIYGKLNVSNKGDLFTMAAEVLKN